MHCYFSLGSFVQRGLLTCVACPPMVQVSPRGAARSPGSASGLQRLEELRGEGLAASCDRLSVGSLNDSFNSEEGFGSPVKQRCE